MENALGELGRRIKKIRVERHLTQNQIAERAGISLSYVYRIEAGQENMTVKTLLKIAEALHISPSELFLPFQKETEIGNKLKVLLENNSEQELEFIFSMLDHYQYLKEIYCNK